MCSMNKESEQLDANILCWQKKYANILHLCSPCHHILTRILLFPCPSYAFSFSNLSPPAPLYKTTIPSVVASLFPLLSRACLMCLFSPCMAQTILQCAMSLSHKLSYTFVTKKQNPYAAHTITTQLPHA